MRKSTKAGLLSAFIFPGAGHIYLKRYVAGVLLAGIAFSAMYYSISKTAAIAVDISDKVQRGDVPLEIGAITELVSQQSSGADAQLLNIATLAVIICWLIGIVDSYRVAHRRETPD